MNACVKYGNKSHSKQKESLSSFNPVSEIVLKSNRRYFQSLLFTSFHIDFCSIIILHLCTFLVFVVNNKYNTEVFSYAYISFHLTKGTLEAVLLAKTRLVLALACQPNSIKSLIK